MKKLIATVVLIILVVSAVNAQFTRIGGGFNYGTGFHFNNETGVLGDLYKNPLAGIFLTSVYEISQPFHISPSFTWFFPRTNSAEAATNGERTRVSSIMSDVNIHYGLTSLPRLQFYGLLGLNVTFSKIKWLNTAPSLTDNAFGLNLGTGTYIKITEQLDFNAELKYILSRYDQFQLNAGLVLNIDWLKKNENH